ncbi:hypothetical protein BJ165DRAFT_1534586 [Panaeolus papilionaceus]|nr:hypothetical protein BJ165DRAFT_1534586 [Panaeolus papilionaceus]
MNHCAELWETQSERANLRSELQRTIRRQKLAIFVLSFILGLFVYLLYICNMRLSVVFQENERYIFGLHRDFTGLKDFALLKNGASVITAMTTPSAAGSSPIKALSPDLNPGSCWRVQSQKGQLALLFKDPIKVTNITVDHVSKYVVSHTTDAPRYLSIWGLRERVRFGL